MPIEIKELLIRAFVTDQKQDDQQENPQKQQQMGTAQDSVAIMANILKQERER